MRNSNWYTGTLWHCLGFETNITSLCRPELIPLICMCEAVCRPDFYHLIFMLASAYIAMIFTSWSLQGASHRLTNSKDWPSVWVKMCSQWLCVLLYIWSLIAPALLKDRQF